MGCENKIGTIITYRYRDQVRGFIELLIGSLQELVLDNPIPVRYGVPLGC
jgi:hypothetical protein